MPLGVGLSLFYRPGGGGFELFFAQGVGNSPMKKFPEGSAGEGDGQAWN